MTTDDAPRSEDVDELRRGLDSARQQVAQLTATLDDERVWRRIVEELPMGINLYRLESPGDAGKLRLIGINRAANEAVGMSMEAFVGLTLEDAMPGALETDAPHACVRALESRQMQALPDLHYDNPDIPGAGRTYSVCTIPLSERHVVVLFDDISEVKRLNEEREQRLNELADANRKLAHVDELKTRFFAHVSHELRTPLTLITGPVLRLLEQPGLSETQRADLELVQRNARYLGRQVDDLLDAARLDAGQLQIHYREADLGVLVRTICSDFDPVARARGIRLDVQSESSMPAVLDAERIGQVLLNLLSNAVRFARSTISVTLRGDADDALLEVVDDGPGVPAERRSQMFERFVRLDDHAGGTGLGLTIARDLVELHAGAIALDEAAGGGALVTVRLPRAAPEGVTRRAATALASADESRAVTSPSSPAVGRTSLPDAPTVLVVEDNSDLAGFIARVLCDYNVHVASDGREGLDLAKALEPDLVLTDIMMPRLSGADLIAALRADPRLGATPIIALTARASEDLRVALLSSGAHDYLAKPFLPQELRARVRNLVTVKRARDLLQSELASREQDVEALARELADKQRELQRTLASRSAALRSAEKASAAKTTFLRLMSHEFNTPLQSLRFGVERLERRLDPASALYQQVKGLRRMTNRLAAMVDGLLDFVRIEKGHFDVKRSDVSVTDIVQAVIQDHREQLDAKGLSLEVRPAAAEVRALSDPEVLRMILNNLIGNAIKYTDRGKVQVDLATDETGLRIEIADTGCGIPRDQYATVFEPFKHLEPIGKKHTPGVGLGLALVREMVDTLGGTIALSSEVGVGSTFRMSLPRGPR